MPLRTMFGGIGYELDQLVVAGGGCGGGMDPAPLLLAGYSGRGSGFGGRSNDVACNLGCAGRGARSVVREELGRSCKRVYEQVQVGRRVALRVSGEVISPLAMGGWGGTVIRPVSTGLGLPMEELEAVLAHELGHIRRWDYLWNLLQTAVESVLFFHPSVWSLSRAVRERRAICCDEHAVPRWTGAPSYEQALVRLEEQRTS